MTTKEVNQEQIKELLQLIANADIAKIEVSEILTEDLKIAAISSIALTNALIDAKKLGEVDFNSIFEAYLVKYKDRLFAAIPDLDLDELKSNIINQLIQDSLA